jgi:hypothetical protein
MAQETGNGYQGVVSHPYGGESRKDGYPTTHSLVMQKT